MVFAVTVGIGFSDESAQGWEGSTSQRSRRTAATSGGDTPRLNA